jgi:hypothetical protein
MKKNRENKTRKQGNLLNKTTIITHDNSLINTDEVIDRLWSSGHSS